MAMIFLTSETADVDVMGDGEVIGSGVGAVGDCTDVSVEYGGI